MLDADEYFLVSYSVLNFVLFLFLAGVVRLRWGPLWRSAGAVLSLVMLVGDWLENKALYLWIDRAQQNLGRGDPSFPHSPPWFLAPATNSKWLSLSLAALLFYLYYLYWLEQPRFLKLLTFPAAFGAGAFWMGLRRYDPDWIVAGMSGLIVLWLGGLVHAVISMMERPSPGLIPTEVSDPG